MLRRQFTAVLAASAVSRAAGRLEHLNRSQPLEQRIRYIEDYVHNHHYDDKGILYSHINFAEERPWRKEDFAGVPGPIGVPINDWMNYENSPMCSGIFLASQCYRYLATKDPKALESAAKAFRSIDVIFRLSEGTGPAPLMQRNGSIDPTDRWEAKTGWISKPYGQMMTTQSSTEQNFGPIWGLYLYRSIAPPENKQRADFIITAVADYWRENRYTINFFGENWEFEKSMPRAQRHMPVWAAINRIAFEVTGAPRFRKEYERLDALFGAMPTARETNRGMGREKYVSTEDRAFHDKEVVIADLLSDLEPSRRDRYQRAMTAWWKFSQTGMRADMFSYYFIELDTHTGEWKPLPKSVKPRPLWNSPWMFQNGTFPVAWGEVAARLAISSAMVARRDPGSGAKVVAQKVFSLLDKEHLRYMIDPHQSLEPELRYMTNVLSADAMSYFPAGYWYGRLHGLWN